MNNPSGITVFAVLMLTGYLLRFILEIVFKANKLYDIVVKILINTLYYFFIPLSLFIVFSNRGFLVIDLFITMYFTVFIITIYYVSRGFFTNETRYAVFILSTYPNSVFLGFPISYILFGNVKIAALLGALTVALNIIVPDLIALRKVSLKSLFTSTAVIGFIVGVVAYYLIPLVAIYTTQSYLWWAVPLMSYLAILVMGLRIPLKLNNNFYNYIKPIVFTSIVRFVFSPLLSLLLSTLFNFVEEDLWQLVVISMMPPAVLNIVIAQKYSWNPQLVALVIAVLTIIFLTIILPILIIFI